MFMAMRVCPALMFNSTQTRISEICPTEQRSHDRGKGKRGSRYHTQSPLSSRGIPLVLHATVAHCQSPPHQGLLPSPPLCTTLRTTHPTTHTLAPITSMHQSTPNIQALVQPQAGQKPYRSSRQPVLATTPPATPAPMLLSGACCRGCRSCRAAGSARGPPA
jgi:hypothetical protein